MNRLRTRALDVAAAVWGVAEATLFFLVPDVLLSWIGLSRGARAAARASVAAALGAGVGGTAMYVWSAVDPATAREAVLAVPAISEAMAARAAQAMAENWFLATLLGPLSSSPFKLYAILAPEWAPLPQFALAAVVVRLPRFLIVSISVALLGRFLRRRFSERQLLWLLGGGWLVFYAAFFISMPN